MHTVTQWHDTVPNRDNIKSTVNDLCFRPDGSQLVVAVGNRVLIYDAADGDLLHSLKGHKNTVYCVGYSKDGKRFASGGADKTIIIWTHKAEGILKYQHNDSIQCLAYNPVTQQLASGTGSDFGLWAPEQKSVSKIKASSKVNCMAWTNDGQHLALGLFSGQISIRDKGGAEKLIIQRNAPVWCLAWNPSKDEAHDILTVGCWDQTLSFYQLSGIQAGKDHNLGFDPCSIGYFTNGEYIVVGGSDRKVSLFTKQGTRLTTIATKNDWVWCCKPRPNQNYVALGCNDGSIAMYQLVFGTVHGLYQDRYAYRDLMTDVIIQHLMTEQKVRIRCRDYVKKIAVYKDRLAVQIPDKVLLYELSPGDEYDMHYRLRDKISGCPECNLLVVTSNHIILCQTQKLLLYNFSGVKEREWSVEAVIRYIKVVGGPPGREGVLAGLKNGTIVKIFVDNPFPINLIKIKTSIRCLDLSANRSKLAIVDEHANLLVYDLRTKDQLFTHPTAASVAWNTEFEDMVCYSGGGMLNIKTGNFPIHQQKLQGFVVGFKGSKIFCLHYLAMTTIDVPQSASLYRYVEKKEFDQAYKVACLGVTESDWKTLAMEALSNMSLEVARQAFIRLRDVRYIELLARIEKEAERPGADHQLFLGEIYAYQGRYQEAAKTFAKAGKIERAVDMFSDLKQFDQAREFANQFKDQNVNIKDLFGRQAEWSEEVKDYRASMEMYKTIGEHSKAIDLMGEHKWSNWEDDMIKLGRGLDKSNTEAIVKCARYLREAKNHAYAAEMYIKAENRSELLKLHLEFHRWDEAFALVEASGEGASEIYLPYAQWLMDNDQFEAAQSAFNKANRPDLSSKLLEGLSYNAVVEKRYEDAGYFFFLLAREQLRTIKQRNNQRGPTKDDQLKIEKFHELYRKGEEYFSYHKLYQDMEFPFTSNQPLGVFNTACFLLSRISKEAPYGISKVYTIMSIAKHSLQLNAFKLGKFAYDRLQSYRLPPHLQDDVDVATITMRSKPFSDAEELIPNCYRCSTPNPILNNQGSACVSCYHPFEHSFMSFETLPLVEFALEDGISDEEAERLIREDPPMGGARSMRGGDGWQESRMGEADMLTLEDDLDDVEQDAFTRLLLSAVPTVEGVYTPVKADRETLKCLRKEEVYVKKWNLGLTNVKGQQMPSPLPKQYFKLMVPELNITLCPNCNHFFLEEDFEFSELKCAFCRQDLSETA